MYPPGHSNPLSLTYSKLPFGVPRYTTFPSASSMSASNAKNTAELGWCMLVMIVFPSSHARSWSILMRATAVVLLSPNVGSSRSTIARSVSGSLRQTSTAADAVSSVRPRRPSCPAPTPLSTSTRSSSAAVAAEDDPLPPTTTTTTTTPLTAANRINNRPGQQGLFPKWQA